MNKKTAVIIIVLLMIVLGAFIYLGFIKGKIDTGNKSNQVETEYSSKPSDLTITGFSGYKLDTITIDNEKVPLIKIPLVTWGGYAALIAANKGLKPNKESLFYKYGKFVVELIREDDSLKQLQGFASGDYPIIWSTMDMLPLIYDAVKNDKRVIPQVFGVFDWSFGGDGIVVRDNVKTPKDLKGKKIVTSGNTPSNFFLLWLLAQSDLFPSDVEIKYVPDAIAAIDSFIADKSIEACVTWSPFIYDTTDPGSKSYVEGTRLLITSKDANQLIADCYITRLDFLKDHSDILTAFSKAMMEGFDLLQKDKQRVLQNIAALFKLTGGANEAALMLGDVHIANYPENVMFFDLENSISAYKIFYLSQEYYRAIGSIPQESFYDAESVINTAILSEIGKNDLFAHQVNRVKNSFNSQGNFNIADLESKNIVLTKDFEINFPAQSIDFDINGNTEVLKKNREFIEKIAEQMNILGTTVVKLIGHLDTSKVEEYKQKGQQVYLEASVHAKIISKKRAEYVKKILVEKYGSDSERIITEGRGWDMPIDTLDQSKNRRVEVQFYSFE